MIRLVHNVYLIHNALNVLALVSCLQLRNVNVLIIIIMSRIFYNVNNVLIYAYNVQQIWIHVYNVMIQQEELSLIVNAYVRTVGTVNTKQIVQIQIAYNVHTHVRGVSVILNALVALVKHTEFMMSQQSYVNAKMDSMMMEQIRIVLRVHSIAKHALMI